MVFNAWLLEQVKKEQLSVDAFHKYVNEVLVKELAENASLLENYKGLHRYTMILRSI